jgi:hypothetical protein
VVTLSERERRSLAEQLLANPLIEYILAKIEHEATEALIFADTEQSRVEAQWRVRSARSFRRDCVNMCRNDPPRKGARA